MTVRQQQLEQVRQIASLVLRAQRAPEAADLLDLWLTEEYQRGYAAGLAAAKGAAA